MASENTTLESWLNESRTDQPWNAIAYVRGRDNDGQEPPESSLDGIDAISPGT